MFKPMLPLAVVAALALTACKEDAQSTPKPSKAPAARVVGDAVSCIPIVQIRSSRVHDDRTIDFDMGGGKIYRNTLPNSCPSLGFEEAFTYETSLSQLCSTDIIYVLQRYGSEVRRGAGCGLGQFVPVELEKK
jgi:hypothetical protein